MKKLILISIFSFFTVSCYAGVSDTGSYFVINSSIIFINSPCTVTATIRSDTGVPLNGKQVTLTTSRGSSDTVTPSIPQTSDSNGQCTWTVQSSIEGTSTLIAYSEEKQITRGINKQGTVGIWRIDENTGTLANEDSDYRNTGTISGALWTSGKAGPCLNFDGVNDYVKIYDSPSVRLNEKLTITSWIYPTSYADTAAGETERVIVSKRQAGGFSFSIGNYDGSSLYTKKLNTWIRTSGSYKILNSTSDVPLNQWSHVAVTYDGNAIKFYLDGNKDNELAATGNIDTNAVALFIGAESGGDVPESSHYFKGLIDEVRIYNRALSDTEIRREYNLSTVLEFVVPATKLKITSSPFLITTGNPSPHIIVEAQTDTGERATYFSESITLSASSPGGKFSIDRVTWQDTSIITLSAGLCAFYYKDSATGNPIITAYRYGLTKDTQTETILNQGVNETASYITFTPYQIPASGVNSATTVVTINDTYGFPITNKLVTLQTTRGPSQDTINDSLGGSVNPQTTNVNGQCTWTIKSLYAGWDTITVTSDGKTITRGVNKYGAVGIWHFDTDTRDVSGYGNNGALYNGVVWTSAPDSAAQGCALQFDGTDDYVQVNDAPSLNVTGNSITIEAWVKATGVNRGLLGKGTYYCYMGGGGNIALALRIGGVWQEKYATVSINNGQWHHWAGVYDGNNIQIYVDGNPDGTKSCSGSIDSSAGTNLKIGVYSGYFNGIIDEVKIYGCALSAAEIKASYNKRANIYFTGNKLKITTPAITTTVDNPSSYIRVEAQDGSGTRDMTFNNTVSLFSSSAGGKFSIARVNWTDTTAITLSNGQAIIYYKDSAPGNPVITVFRSEFLYETQTETIVGPSVNETASYIITFTPYLILANGDSVCTAVVTINDTYGFPITNKLVTLQTTRGNSDTINDSIGGTVNPQTTDANGICTWTIKSGYAGQDTITARCDGNTIARGVNKYGAVGIWHFDTDTKDVSGYGNDGIIIGGNTAPLWVSAPDSAAQGCALQFDGVDDYVQIASFGFDYNYMTFEAWIYAKNLNSRHSLFGQGNTSNLPHIEVGTGLGGTKRVVVIMPLVWEAETVDNVIDVNAWYHIAVVKNGGGTAPKIYVNGVQKSLITSSPATYAATSVAKQIGQRGNSAQWFDGIIDEVKIYNRALSDTEIKASYYKTANIYFSAFSQTTSETCSYIKVSSTYIPADGSTQCTVTITVKDTAGLVLYGKTVNLNTSRGATYDTITQPAPTDVNGQCTGYIKSSRWGEDTVTATCDGVTITMNLIRNPSMEEGALPEWSAGWSGVLSKDTTEYHSGQASAKVTRPDNATSILLQSNIQLNRGAAYKLSFYAKCSTSKTGGVSVNQWDTWQSCGLNENFNLGTSWTYNIHNFVASGNFTGNDINDAYLQFAVVHDSSETWWIDDVRFMRIPTCNFTASKLKIVTPSFVATINNPSAYIKVEAQDDIGSKDASFNNTVTLTSSSSPGGKFSIDRITWQDTSIITLSAGSATFYYKDSALGNPVITVFRSEFPYETQTETIVGPSVNETASYITFTPYLILANGDSVCTAVVTINDTYGFPITNKLVTLQTTRGNSDTINDSIGGTVNPQTTDANGICTWTIKSGYAGQDTITARCDGNTIARGVNKYGAVGIWHFDTDTKDVSGYGNDGIIIGGNTAPLWVSAPDSAAFGSALQFDGVNDYVDCGNKSSLNVADAITIEAWIKTGVAQSQTIVAKHSGGTGGSFYLATISTGIRLTIINSTPVRIDLDRAFTYNNNIWHHIVGVYNGSQMSIYGDGVFLSPSAAQSGSIQTTPYTLKIGTYEGVGWFYNGLIDEVKIYNRALSDTEIKREYNHLSTVLEFVDPNAILKITSPPFIVTQNNPSPPITVEIQDIFGNSNPAFNDTIVLSSSSANGKFSLQKNPWSDTTIIYLQGGLQTFYYQDSNTGNPFITVSRSGSTASTQSETILMPSVNNTVSFIIPYRPYASADGQETITVIVAINDTFGFPISGKSVTLFTNKPDSDTILANPLVTDINGRCTFALSSIAVGEDTVAASCEGQTLSYFVDDFSIYPEGGNGSPNWSTIAGTWKVTNSSFIVNESTVAGEFRTYLENVNFTNCMLEADVDIKAVVDTARWVGIQVRKQKGNNNGYVLLFRKNGTVQLFEYTNGWNFATAKTVSTTATLPAKIGLKAEGNQLTCYLGGQEVYTTTNDTYSMGEVMLLASGAYATYDNVRIYPCQVSFKNYALVQGVVYNDINENQVQDTGEIGVSGVLVSDGVKVVLSGNTGTYKIYRSFEGTDTAFIFVTIPSGYKKTTEFYQQVTMSPGETKNCNFGVCEFPTSADTNFSFIQITDIHIVDTTGRDQFIEDIQQMNVSSYNPSFVVPTGDLVNTGDNISEYQNYTSALDSFTMPVYNVIGNHDYNAGTTTNYKDFLGPTYYSFDWGGRHFVVLDSVSNVSSQLSWLEKDLAFQPSNKEIIAFYHYSEQQQFVEFLSTYNTIGIFNGHWHSNKIYKYNQTLMVETPPLRFGGIDSTPRGFRLVSFNNGVMQTDFRHAGLNNYLVIVHPADGEMVGDTNTDILANVYDTRMKIANVNYQIDGGAWNSMQKKGKYTWRTTWNPSGSTGSHSLKVRATSDTGATWENVINFTVSNTFVTPVPKPSSNWSMFLHDAQRTGLSEDKVAPPLYLKWIYSSDGSLNFSSPVVYGDRVYVGVEDEDGLDKNAVVCLDASTGEEKWKFPTDSGIKHTIAVYDGIVYAQSIAGILYAIDAGSGGEEWKHYCGSSDVNELGRSRWSYWAPVVDNGFVYCGGAGYFTKLNAVTGAKEWDINLGSDWIPHYSSPAVRNDRVYIGLNWGSGFHSRYTSNGGQEWVLGGNFQVTPTISDTAIYITESGSAHYALNFSGGTIWNKSFGGSWATSSAAISGNRLYIGSPSGYVYGYDVSTGDPVWQRYTGPAILSTSPYVRGGSCVTSSPAISENVVYVGSQDGFLYALNATNGDTLWTYNIGVPVASSPAVSGNAVYAGAFDGNVYAFCARPPLINVSKTHQNLRTGMSNNPLSAIFEDTVRYDIFITNNGAETAANVIITDTSIFDTSSGHSVEFISFDTGSIDSYSYTTKINPQESDWTAGYPPDSTSVKGLRWKFNSISVGDIRTIENVRIRVKSFLSFVPIVNYGSFTYQDNNGNTWCALSNTLDVKTKSTLLQPMFGLRLSSLGNRITLTWRTISQYSDGETCTLSKYLIYRSSISGGPYSLIGETVSLSFTDTVPLSPKGYYVVLAQDNLGNKNLPSLEIDSEENVTIRSISEENVTIRGINLDIEGDAYTSLRLSKATDQVLYKETNNRGDDIRIEISSQLTVPSSQMKGQLVKAYDFVPYLGNTNNVAQNFKFTSPALLTIRYEIDTATNYIKGTNLPASRAKDKLGLFFWNGLEWVKLGANIDISNQALSIQTDHLSRYAIFTTTNATKLTLTKRIPPILTPNGDGINDVCFFYYENPNNKSITGRIYDLSGSLIYSQLSNGPTTNSLKWDGKDDYGNTVESGIYIYQIQGGDELISGSIVVAR